MVNPKDFAPTPWSHKGRVDKSGPNKNLSAHGRPTDVKATGMEMQSATPKSGSGHKGLGHPSFEGIGNPYPVSSDRSEMGASFAKPGKINKSKPKTAAAPTSWKNKGYHMGVPSTDAEGAAVAKKMKAH